MSAFDPIFDYVRLVTNECAPYFAIDDNGEPVQDESQLSNILIKRLEELEFPFTKQEYYDNTNIIDTLKAYQIDIEKFWYAILAIYHVTKSKIEDGAKVPPRIIDQFHSLLDYLKNGKDIAITVTAKDKKKSLVIREKLVLNTLADMLHEFMPEIQEHPWCQGREWQLYEKAKVGNKASSQIGYATARYQALFDNMKLDRKRVKHSKSKVETIDGQRHINVGMTDGGASMSRLLLISRLLHLSCFTKNDEYLHSEEPLNGILKDYKNAGKGIISKEYLM